MPNGSQSILTQDEHHISSLLIRWGHARDSGDWETLAQCFHENATIHISWISGPAKQFIASVRTMAKKRTPGEQTKHLISGPWIQVNQDRSFSRCHVNLYMRFKLDGMEFDLQSWLRFFDLLEKRQDTWRIVKRTAVYEKDRLDVVDPRGVPNDFFTEMDLSSFPQSAKYLCYFLLRTVGPPATDIISVYTDEERTLINEGKAWIG